MVIHIDIDLMMMNIILSNNGTFHEQCSFNSHSIILNILRIIGSALMLTSFLPSTHHCRARVYEEVGKVIEGHFHKKTMWRKCLHKDRM